MPRSIATKIEDTFQALHEPHPSLPEVFTINVSSTLFTVSPTTVCSRPASILCQLIVGHYSGEHPLRVDRFDNIFLEIDPVPFRILLNILRGYTVMAALKGTPCDPEVLATVAEELGIWDVVDFFGPQEDRYKNKPLCVLVHQFPTGVATFNLTKYSENNRYMRSTYVSGTHGVGVLHVASGYCIIYLPAGYLLSRHTYNHPVVELQKKPPQVRPGEIMEVVIERNSTTIFANSIVVSVSSAFSDLEIVVVTLVARTQ